MEEPRDLVATHGVLPDDVWTRSAGGLHTLSRPSLPPLHASQQHKLPSGRARMRGGKGVGGVSPLTCRQALAAAGHPVTFEDCMYLQCPRPASPTKNPHPTVTLLEPLTSLSYPALSPTFTSGPL
eukprot:SAG25_NODE_542_length_7058_cov_1.916942_3_plen_125_part_00